MLHDIYTFYKNYIINRNLNPVDAYIINYLS